MTVEAVQIYARVGPLDDTEARTAAWIARHGYREDGSYIRGWENDVGQHPPADFDWRTQVGPDGRWLRGAQ